MKHKLIDNKAYTNFTDARDRVLEKLLFNTRAEIADLLRSYKHDVKGELARMYPLVGKGEVSYMAISHLRQIDSNLETMARQTINKVSHVWHKLRKRSYLLAYAGEWQAINNAGYGGRAKKIQKQLGNTTLGPLEIRTRLAFSKLRRKVMQAVEQAQLMGFETEEAIAHALDAFPRGERVKAPRILPRSSSYKESKRLDENGDEVDDEGDNGIVDTTPTEYMTEEEWNDIVDAYKETYIPKWRDPAVGSVDVETPEGLTMYPWEVENEVTEDFVQQVRDGANESANANGITDMMWLAVIDKKTDECCRKRDGLTSAEIADKLKGEWADDDCQVIVPPAHFNCRCRPVPTSDDVPKYEGNGVDYETWMHPNG